MAHSRPMNMDDLPTCIGNLSVCGLPKLHKVSNNLLKDLLKWIGDDTINELLSLTNKNLTKLPFPMGNHILNLSQRFVNHLVQSGIQYGFVTNVSEQAHKVLVKLNINKNKWTFTTTQHNGKDLNQYVQVAVALIYAVEFSRPVPQSGIQMSPEDTLEQAEIVQKSQNTEITQAVDIVEVPFEPPSSFLQTQATSLDPLSFSELTERYIPIFSGTFQVSDVIDQLIVSLELPSALYDNLDTSTATPLRPFTLFKCDNEITIKINSNQAQCGRYIAAFFPCKIQAFGAADSVWRNIQREHAEINIASSADVVYNVTYENLRPFVPIQSDELGGITGDSFGRFTIRCLSPVNIVTGGQTTVPFQVFGRFRKPFLTGMRYPLPTTELTRRARTRAEIQNDLIRGGVESNPGPVFNIVDILHIEYIMHWILTTYLSLVLRHPVPQAGLGSSPVSGSSAKGKAIEIVKDVSSAAKSIPVFGALFKWMANIGSNVATSISRLVASESFTANFENNLVYVGLKNKDKPVDIRPHMVVQPIAQKPMCHGLGPISATKMRLEQGSNTAHTSEFDTIQTSESYSQLAQIGGIQTTFGLSVAQTNGTLLCELPAAPFDSRYLPPGNNATGYHFPPVAYFMNMFQGYAGQIEYEIIPVKTASHNFSILIGFVPFHGTPGTTTFQQIQSCEYKVIDFRAQDSGVYTVPWISTSLFRQYPGIPLSNLASVTPNSATLQAADMQWKDPGKVCIFLVNPLNVTPIVSPVIEVIVKVRATSNFQYIIPTTMRLRPVPGQDVGLASPIITGDPAPIIPQSGIQIESTEELPGDKVRSFIGPQIQTMELHDDINNVNRRFTAYMPVRLSSYQRDGETFSGQPLVAIIPIVLSDPYFRVQNVIRSSDSLNLEHYNRSPRDATVACFRWYRGGATLSINHQTPANANHNLVISHIPPMMRPTFLNAHSYTSTESSFFGLTSTQAPLINGPDSAGYATLRAGVQTVNQVTDVEIPFYGTNNYLDIQARYAPNMTIGSINGNPNNILNGPIYDTVSRTLGHLVLQLEYWPATSEEAEALSNAIRINIKMAFADDGKLYHFMGTPPMRMTEYSTLVPAFSTLLRREYAEELQSADKNRVLTKQEIQSLLIQGGVESNPGPVYVPENEIHPQGYISDFYRKVKSTFDGLLSFPGKAAELVKTGDLLNSTIESITEKFKVQLAMFSNVPYAMIVTLVSQIVIAVKHPSKMTAVVALATFLYSVGIFQQSLVDKITASITSLLTPNAEPQAYTKDAPKDNFLIGLLASGIIEFFIQRSKDNGVEINRDDIDETPLVKRIGKIFSNLNFSRMSTVMILFSRVTNVVVYLCDNVWTWLLKKFCSPDIIGHEKMVENFMIDHAFVMDVLNENSYTAIRQHRDRFWTTICIAHYLNNYMAQYNVRNPTLQKAISDIIRKSQELGKKAQACPVRYEPYVIWNVGPAGVGKSYLMQNLMHGMLQALEKDGIHIIHPNPMYTRTQMSQFWDGYSDQPIVYYDDVGAVSSPEFDPIVVGELMSLKSCGQMPINMAHLSDKCTTMSSMIVGIASNQYSLKSSCIYDQDAFDRRRNMLVVTKFSDEANDWFKKHDIKRATTSDLAAAAISDPDIQKMLDENRHVKFGRFTEVKGVGRTTSDPQPDIWYDYKNFVTLLHEEFRAYNQREVTSMAKRYKDMLAFMPHYVTQLTDAESCKAAIMQMTLQVEDKYTGVASETLKTLLFRLKNQTPEYWHTLHESTQQNIDFLKKKTQPQGSSTILRFKNEQIAKQSGEYILSRLGKTYRKDSSLWSRCTDLYDSLFSWKTPLTEPTLELTEELMCASCLRNTSEPAFVCPKSDSQAIHILCSCSLLTEKPLCPHCTVHMIPLSPPLERTTFAVAAKFVASTEEFLSQSYRRVIASDLKQEGAYTKRILDLTTAACLLHQRIESKYLQVKKTNPVCFETEAIRSFVHYTGVYPRDVKYVTNQDGTPKTAYMTWHFDDTNFEINVYNDVFVTRHYSGPIPQGPKKKIEPPVHVEFKKQEEIPSTSQQTTEVGKEEEEFGLPHMKQLKCNVIHTDECVHCLQDVAHMLNNDNAHSLIKLKLITDENVQMDYIQSYNEDNEILSTVPLAICMDKGEVVCKVFDHEKYWVRAFEALKQQHLHISFLSPAKQPAVYIEWQKAIEEFKASKVDKTEPAKPTKEQLTRWQKWHHGLKTAVQSWLLGPFFALYEFCKTHVKMILSLIVMALGTYFGYKTYFCEDTEMLLPETGEPQSEWTHKSGKMARRPIARALNTRSRGQQNVTQMSPIPNSFTVRDIPAPVNQAVEVYRQNVLTFIIGTTRFFALGLRGHSVVIALHAWEQIVFMCRTYGLDSFNMHGQGRDAKTVKIADCLVVKMPHTEMAYITLPSKGMQAFRDISKRALPKIDTYGLEIIHCLPPTAYLVDVSDLCTLKVANVLDVIFNPTLQFTYVEELNGVQYEMPYVNKDIDEWMRTSIQKPGMCMSPYMDVNGNIIALHVAGQANIISNEVGFATPLYREDIDDALGHRDASHAAWLDHEFVQSRAQFPESFNKAQVEGIGFQNRFTIDQLKDVRAQTGYPQSGLYDNLTYEYTVIDSPYHTHETKILPSPLQAHLYNPETEPCIQSSKDPRYTYGGDPLLDGVATIGSETTEISQHMYNISVSGVQDEIIGKMIAPYISPPVTSHEALTATLSPVCNSMNLSTGAGYPLAKCGTLEKQKKEFIDTKTRDLHHSIAAEFESDFQDRCAGKEINTVYWAHLKDETRPVEKLMRKGGTRVFSVAPFESVVNSRRIVLPFMDSFQSTPLELHHAIGLDPHSLDWTELYIKAREKGNKLILIDFKNFSDSLPTQFVIAAFDIIASYYQKWGMLTKEIALALQTIANDTAHSHLLVYEHVYRVNNGVLAGHPLTSIINSLVNLMLQVYAWVKITKRLPAEFFKSCYIIVMGDDVLTSVPDEVIELGYTCDKICEVFLQDLNIIATDGNKNKENIRPYETFDQFEFLSRSMSPHPTRPGIMLSPLKTVSLFEVPLWIHKGDLELRVIESIQQTLQLAYSHGPTFFNALREVLLSTDETPQFEYFTWHDIDTIFFGVDEDSGVSTTRSNLSVDPGVTPVTTRSNLTGDIDCTENFNKSIIGSNLSADSLFLCQRPRPSMRMKVLKKEYECKCRYDCMKVLKKKIEEINLRKKTTLPDINYLKRMTLLTKVRTANKIPTTRLTNLPFDNLKEVSASTRGLTNLSFTSGTPARRLTNLSFDAPEPTQQQTRDIYPVRDITPIAKQ